jgi:hypothetical protein
MRNKSLDALFPRVRQRILTVLLMNPEQPWYASDLAHHLRTTPSSLQRDLFRLSKAGILRSWKDGNRAYFQANIQSPLFPQLQQLMIKTTGLVDVLKRLLTPFADRIHVAFIHGSVATAQESAPSDIDLFIVGHLGLKDLAPALRAAREQVGREVSASVYSLQEFEIKVSSGHHFVHSVIGRKKLFIIGNQNVLDEVAGRKTRRGRTGDAAGD